MKPSDKHITILTPALLIWLMPLLLIVPNVWLSCTEPYPGPVKTANVLLPLGVYYLLMSVWKRTGTTTLLMLPVVFFGAFQIVLLYLYGESIIAVDMFMNVATTSVGEATELLGNLWVAILTVLLLYLPPLAFGIYLIVKKRYATNGQLMTGRLAGTVIAGAGLLSALCAYAGEGGYRMDRQLFPVNVCCNLAEAVHRVGQARNYTETSADYAFHAVSLRNDSVPEVYVLVIGETSRADNWELFGYERPTNPRLSQRNGLLKYGRVLSESNTTHKSVPMLMSNLTADNFGDSVNKVKSIFEAFNEAGVHTAVISNQAPNHSYIDMFSSQANEHSRICSDGGAHQDHELLDRLKDCIECNHGKKLFITLHTYGSHYCYQERYPEEYRYFRPDDVTEASVGNRAQLINAYDNSIRYTDAMLDSIIDILDNRHCHSVMVYTSDHGEDIFDDSRERFLHASPTPTYWQLHVPMVIWMSPEFIESHPGMYMAAEANQGKEVSSTRTVFDTMLNLAGICADGCNPQKSLCSPAYREPEHRYLNDYNEGVALTESGLKAWDYTMLSKL